MQGRRVDRIEEQLRIEISEIIEREIQDPRVHFVTTTRVKVTPDLGHARVFITVLGNADERKKALQGLHSAAHFVKRSLAKRLHHLRRVPELIFEYDETVEKDLRLEALLGQISSEGEK
jgi:ribosome-binding factor A